MAAPASFEDTLRSIASLHLDIGGTEQRSPIAARDEAFGVDAAPSKMPLGGASAGADAAAGGSRGAAGHESSTRAGRKSCSVDLQLPIEALGGSRVASAGAVQLEQSIQDAATLHSRAMGAIDRIARQHAALRRFPMACPACGTLNAPQGLSWGAGDIVACQGCNHSFVPLGHGLQDGDLNLLRTAVQQMRVQSERAQYLEQVILRSKAASPSAALSPPPPPHHSRRGQASGRSESVPGRCAESPSGLHQQLRRSPTRRSPISASDDQEGTPKNKTRSAALPNMAASPKDAAHSAAMEAAEAPKLVSLLDTQDLLTDSSDASSRAPCFYGRKLRHRQPSLDTWQNMQRNISNLFTAKAPRPREREEGELTSASGEYGLSDGEISSASSFTGRACRYTPRCAAEAASVCAGQNRKHAQLPHAASSLEARVDSPSQDVWGSASELQITAAQLSAAAKQLLLLVLTLAVHLALGIVFDALGFGRAMATTVLTATLNSTMKFRSRTPGREAIR